MQKGLLIRPIAGTTMVEIYYQGGGRLPDDLQGQFTSIAAADRTLQLYREGIRNRIKVIGPRKNK